MTLRLQVDFGSGHYVMLLPYFLHMCLILQQSSQHRKRMAYIYLHVPSQAVGKDVMSTACSRFCQMQDILRRSKRFVKPFALGGRVGCSAGHRAMASPAVLGRSGAGASRSAHLG